MKRFRIDPIAVIEISNSLDMNEEGEYSYTTHEVGKNVDKILQRDLSNEKRFRVGHKLIDDATKGFRYGDLLLVLYLSNLTLANSI